MNFSATLLYTSPLIHEIHKSEDFLIITQKFTLNSFAKFEILLSAEFILRPQFSVHPVKEGSYLLGEQQLIFSDCPTVNRPQKDRNPSKTPAQTISTRGNARISV